MRPGVVVAVLAAVVVAGVGAVALTRSSGSSSQSVTAQSPSPTSSDLAADDEQAASNLTLSRSDFPSQWTANTHAESAAARAASTQLAECSAQVPRAPSPPPNVHQRSLDFTSGLFTASSVVDIETSTAKVAADFASISDSKFLECIHDVIVDELGGPQVCACLGIDVQALQIVPPVDAPPMTYAFRVRATQHQAVLAQIDGYLIGQGRTELTVMFLGRTGPFPVDFGADLLRKTLQRLNQNPTN